MKVGIVTVYHSYNCGSFLQAYAMQQTVQQMGHKVCFLKNKRTLQSRLWYRLLQSLKYTLKGNKKRAKHLLGVYYNFKKAQKNFVDKKSSRGLDLVIYGSDTIWNIEDDYFLRSWRRFFGADFEGNKIVYGASLGETEVESVLNRSYLCEAIAAFDEVAVRDEETYQLVESCRRAQKMPLFVVDPTMLLTKQDYIEIAPETHQNSYILFYYFQSIPENIKKQVRDFADTTGRKIIAFGDDNGWADEYISNDPFLMLSYYKNADFVITNTFHGNVFSIIFNKQFVSFGKEKQKVCNLLKRFGLEERLADEKDNISELLEKKIEYSDVNVRIELMRRDSLNYLKKTLIDNKDK